MNLQHRINVESGVLLRDLNEIAERRGTLISLSERRPQKEWLFEVRGEVGLWTFEELKKYFLN